MWHVIQAWTWEVLPQREVKGIKNLPTPAESWYMLLAQQGSRKSMYCLLFYVFFFSVLFKYFKVHLDDSSHLHTNLRYYSNPHYPYFTHFNRCPSWGQWALAERAVGSHLNTHCPGWLLLAPGECQVSQIASAASQRAEESREKQTSEANCLRDSTLPLGLQESASGAVCSEWHCPGSLWRMTDQLWGQDPWIRR